MKNIIFFLLAAFLVFSCGNSSAETKELDKEEDFELNSDSKETNGLTTSENKSDLDSNTEVNSQLNDLFNMGKNALQESEKTKKSDMPLLNTEMMLDLLEQSGVSRESMEKLINNPDSLKILVQQKMEERQKAKENDPVIKRKIIKEQLTSKSTPTGVSLEEAILIVQAESGPEATIEKLKTIDSLAGTNMMSQLDLTEAGYIMKDVERKHEIPASREENQKITAYRYKSLNMHSEKDSGEFLSELEATEKAIASGQLNASPRFKRAIENRKKAVTIFHKDIILKSEAAKKKFKQLNPDLYYGDEVGVSYVGHMKKTVYLPLGPLSFADEVVQVDHPKLLTQNVKNVLGEPDVILTFDSATGDYSLGLAGTLTIRFTDNALVDVNGPDLYLFEVGEIEPTDLEISKDGKSWIKIGKIDGGVAEVDIAPFVKPNELFYYVRFKDLKGKSAVPGADIDAIAAIGSAMRLNLDSQVLFDTGKSELKPKGLDALKKLINSITVLKKGKVIIEGHTDDIGSDERPTMPCL